MRGRPSQGASAVLKGAPLAPLRFLHAHSWLVASSCIEGCGLDQLSIDYCTTWVTTAKKYKCADTRSRCYLVALSTRLSVFVNVQSWPERLAQLTRRG